MATAERVLLVADRTPDRLVAKLAPEAVVKLIIVDLTLEIGDLSEALATLTARCPNAMSIAYGPHVHEAKLQSAVEAEFDQVMTRGQFDHQMRSLLSSAAAID